MSSNETTNLWQQLAPLVERAQQGDQTVLPALRQFLDEHPEVWKEAGDLALQAQCAWIHMIAGTDLLAQEALERQLQALQAELGGLEPSALERLLVQRITATWLQLHHAEAVYPRMQGATPAQHLAAQKRISLAQTRYLQAIKALATVRKLLRPALAPLEIATRLSARRDAVPSVNLRGSNPVLAGISN